jgi:hypothetical protein
MSRPRVNASSEERDGQRGFLSVPTEMYADREIGARNFRRRSIRDRLGGNVEHFSFSRQNNGKRAREDDGKWKHDLFEDKDVEEGQIVSILHMISVYFSDWILFFPLTISLTVISDKMKCHLLLLGVMCGSDLDASVT